MTIREWWTTAREARSIEPDSNGYSRLCSSGFWAGNSVSAMIFATESADCLLILAVRSNPNSSPCLFRASTTPSVTRVS